MLLVQFLNGSGNWNPGTRNNLKVILFKSINMCD